MGLFPGDLLTFRGRVNNEGSPVVGGNEMRTVENAECIFWCCVFETKNLQVQEQKYTVANVWYPTNIWWQVVVSVISFVQKVQQDS